MFFAVAKFVFERESFTSNDRKELHSLVEKLRSRFRVCVKPSAEFKNDGEPSLVVAALNISETDLNRELDAIAEFCENSGFGRIEAEVSFMDHIDSLGEESE